MVNLTRYPVYSCTVQGNLYIQFCVSMGDPIELTTSAVASTSNPMVKVKLPSSIIASMKRTSSQARDNVRKRAVGFAAGARLQQDVMENTEKSEPCPDSV